MKELVEYLAKALVEDPSQVVATEIVHGTDVTVELKVAQSDMGRVIGRSGRVINAIRTLAQMCAARDGQRAFVELIEDDED
jgi:predicted RNA-binding protein YlqC (UPF0109 family)